MKSLLKIIFPLFITIILSCDSANEKALFIEADNPNLEYMGRNTSSDSTVEMYWSGSSVKINFSGSRIKACLKDEKGLNYFNVIIDNHITHHLHLGASKKLYTLAEHLTAGRHSAELFKRTEWTKGKTVFYGFQLDNDAEIFEIPPKKKMIEFYGNSITAGYAVEDFTGDSPDSIYTNNYNSYAAITARHFDAEYSCIARSGIGIMVSWFPQIMDELYYRQNPADPRSKWDFRSKTPNVVVINLFQNDSWLVKRPNFKEFIHRFGKKAPAASRIVTAYADFVKKIRANYPKTNIICMLGTMDITAPDSPWPGYVSKAVSSLHDAHIYTLFLPYKNTSGHPKVKEQKAMADSLINFIEKNRLL